MQEKVWRANLKNWLYSADNEAVIVTLFLCNDKLADIFKVNVLLECLLAFINSRLSSCKDITKRIMV